MELQHFINENLDNYSSLFKKYELKVMNYNQLGLMMVKAKYNFDYDYEKNPWIRYCRGVVINTVTNKVICIPPRKAIQKENIYDFLNENEYNNDNISIQPLIDGTMINMFYHNNEWFICTRSNIGAKNSWDGKVPFHKMFKEINGDEWFSELDIHSCYSFVLRHNKNRIISPVETNEIYLIERHMVFEDNITKAELPFIVGITNTCDIKTDNLMCYNDINLNYRFKGFTVKKHDGERINWINPNYVHVGELKMNYNHPFLNYIELRQKKKLTEYLNYFPEARYLFDEYRNKLIKIKEDIYESYVSIFIKKENEMKNVNYSIRPLLYKLHGYYHKSGEKINRKIVSDYLYQLPCKKLLFIYNYY
jgi:hypothetical protein